MSKFLFKTLFPDEPFCLVIDQGADSLWETITFRCDMHAVEKYVELIDYYNCDSISLSINSCTTGKIELPDFSGLKDFSRIRSFSISGCDLKNKIDEKAFNEFLKPFKCLKALTLIGAVFGKLNLVLPKLQILHYDRRCIQINDLKDRCPKLEILCIDYMNSDLSELGGHSSLKKMVLYGSRISTLDYMCSFTNLQIFHLEGQRVIVDVSSLNCLKKLEALKVESPKFHLGWDKLKLNNIKNIFVNKIETTVVIDNNESLVYFGTNKEPLFITDNTLSRGWVKNETGSYGIGGRAIPKELRK